MTGWTEVLHQARRCTDALAYSALARRAEKLLVAEGAPATHQPLKLALLGGATLETLQRPLVLALMERGLAPDLFVAPYGVFDAEMIDPRSATASFGPEIAVLLLTPANIPAWPSPEATLAEAQNTAEEVVDHLLGVCLGFHRRTGAEIVLNNFHGRPTANGNLAAKLPGDPNNFIQRVNLMLGDRAPDFVHLNDVAGLSAQHGLSRWFDPRLWFEAKQPVSPELALELVRNVAAIVGALRGRSKKVLAVDLDNTLWGGVIAEEGLHGIELGEGTAVGEAHAALQRYLLELKNRGVLLAACSKNEEPDALLPLQQHEGTVLTPRDFVAFHAGWGPKSDSLARIAAELGLGLDAFVFLDDNPAEREEVRRALPEVTVLEVSDDPSDYVHAIEAGRHFEPAVVTTEDRRRSDLYASRCRERVLAEASRDLSEFLASLEMRAVVKPFAEADLDRITQLVNKTNQFNLTTRRMSRSEVEQLARDPGWIHRSVRLSDRFGHHGLIAVVMGRVAEETLVFENWLMSCRVLKRGVERLLLEVAVSAARERGLRAIAGCYVPTSKNRLVEGLYSELGFERVEHDQPGTAWKLELDRFVPLPHFIELEEEAV